MPGFWSSQNSGMSWSVGSADAGQYYTYPVSQGGQTAIAMFNNPALVSQWYAGPASAELDGFYISIHPGDHIVYKAWLWTDASSIGDTNQHSGAVLGIDLYGSQGRLCEVSTPEGTTTYPSYPSTHLQDVVPWGSYRWVQVSINFVVQGQYMADPWGAYGAGGTYAAPIAFIPWICADSAHSSQETGKIYVTNTELYINP